MLLFQVDAFADGPFTGNPAAICLMDRDAPDAWLQALAVENNLSETAYLWPIPAPAPDLIAELRPPAKAEPHFRLRWFTPATEVALCGHATLASAHALFEAALVAPTATIHFHTKSGVLTASRTGDWLQLDFPAEPPTPVPANEIPPGLLESLGLAKFRSQSLPAEGLPKAKPRLPTPDSRFPTLHVARNRFDYLVQVPDARVVRELDPDFRALKQITTRGTIVTARADDARFDFISRFFAPAENIDEDPVTGSAHCALAPWWSPQLGNKRAMTGYQASKRGGVVRTELAANNRVLLLGKAVTIFRAELSPAAQPK